MGKNEEEQVKEKEDEKVPKKKIIKKVILKSKDEDDQLKNWKPTKITGKDEGNKQTKNKTNNIASEFLQSLPKPINPDEDEQMVKNHLLRSSSLAKSKLKPVQSQLTQQQIKWDVEDQTFIRKQFLPNQQKIQEEIPEPQEQIVYMNGNESKVKHINISKVIEDNQKETTQKNQRHNELWQGAKGLLDGRGQLANLANDAIKRADQIDDSINKRAMEKKQMKNRYGW